MNLPAGHSPHSDDINIIVYTFQLSLKFFVGSKASWSAHSTPSFWADSDHYVITLRIVFGQTIEVRCTPSLPYYELLLVYIPSYKLWQGTA